MKQLIRKASDELIRRRVEDVSAVIPLLLPSGGIG
jgi:hypothetical protein